MATQSSNGFPDSIDWSETDLTLKSLTVGNIDATSGNIINELQEYARTQVVEGFQRVGFDIIPLFENNITLIVSDATTPDSAKHIRLTGTLSGSTLIDPSPVRNGRIRGIDRANLYSHITAFGDFNASRLSNVMLSVNDTSNEFTLDADWTFSTNVDELILIYDVYNRTYNIGGPNAQPPTNNGTYTLDKTTGEIIT